MSIWTDLLSLHGYLTPPHDDDADHECTTPAARRAEQADRLRELIGSRAPSCPRPPPRGPLLGVRGLA